MDLKKLKENLSLTPKSKIIEEVCKTEEGKKLLQDIADQNIDLQKKNKRVSNSIKTLINF